MTELALATLNQPRYDAALEGLEKARRDIVNPENLTYIKRRSEQRQIDARVLLNEMRLTATSLAFAQIYYLSDQIRSLLDLAASSVPSDMEITRELFPAEYGFVHFQTPVPVESWDAKHPEDGVLKGAMHALSWAMYRTLSKQEADIARSRPGATVMGNDEYNLTSAVPGETELVVDPDHVLLTIWLVPFSRQDGTYNTARDISLLIPCTVPVVFGDEFMDAVDVDDQENKVSSHSGRYCLGLMMAFMKFCMQKILEPEERSFSRAAIRNLERKSKQKEPHRKTFKVVRLRQRSRQAGETDEEAEKRHIAWQCQWMVAGHWRHYTGAGGRKAQTIWISPYLKGPESKPLKASSTPKIFAVIR